MAIFEIEAPDGQVYEVDAPDEASALQAFRGLGGADDFTENVDPWVQERANLIESASNPNWFSDASQSVIGKGIPFSDEIVGTLMTPVQAISDWAGGQGFDIGRSFDRSIGLQRELQRRRDERSPIASTVGAVAGGTLLGMGSAAPGGVPTGISALTASVQPASLGGRMALGAAEGAAIGGLYGAGEGEGGVTERLMPAAAGAATGGLIGGAFPLLAGGVGAAYRNVANRLTANRTALNAGIEPDVASLLARTMSADDTLGPQGMANMSKAGQEAMLADAGPNAQAVLDTAIQRGGAGGNLAQVRISERVARDTQRLTNVLDDTLGSPQGVTASRTAIREGSRANIRQMYDKAYSTPIDYASDIGRSIEDMVKNRVPINVINQANRLMQLEGNQSKQILARVADDGSYTLEKLPDVRQIDYITRALNQAAESGEGAGALGGQTDLGRAYQSLARDLRNATRTAVPQYDVALNTAMDPIRRSKAVESGSRLLSPSVRRDQVSELIKGATDAEKAAMAQGVRSQIDDTVANVRRTLADGDLAPREAYQAIRDLSSRANREKISMVIGDKKAGALFDELDRIAQSFNLRSSVAQNSKTFARQATNEAVQRMTEPGVVGRVGQGEPLQAGKRIVQMLTGQTPDAQIARQDQLYSRVADLLTQPSVNAIPTLQATQQYARQVGINELTANEIARILAQGRFAAYPASASIAGSF